MLHRILIACVGGFVITAAMFLGMSEVSKLFKERDPTRYFTIFDVLPAPPAAPLERVEALRAPDLPIIERQASPANTIDPGVRIDPRLDVNPGASVPSPQRPSRPSPRSDEND